MTAITLRIDEALAAQIDAWRGRFKPASLSRSQAVAALVEAALAHEKLSKTKALLASSQRTGGKPKAGG